MLKFIRRLFILLVLFLVVFVVYRYINPDGASRLVDNIKSIPDSISSMFGSDKQDNIKVDGETISVSGDVNLLQDSDQDIDDDLSWLESLNQEIEGILWKDKTWVVIDESFLEDSSVEKTEEVNTWVIVATWNTINTWVSTTVVTWNTVKTGTTTTNTTIKKTNKLNDSDYQQIKDVFGNLVE